MRKVVLIDGMNLVYRSYHKNKLTTDAGEPSGCIYGFMKLVLDMYRVQGQADVVVFWEGGIGTAKPKESYKKALARDLYKSQRTPHEDIASILHQMHEVQALCGILGIGQVSIPGMQADDAIGLFCKAYSEDRGVSEVLIYSNDSDYNQLISDNVFVLHKGSSKLERITEKHIINEYVITPQYWPDWRALCGKPSDNYKGVKGVGPVTATKLIADGVWPHVKDFNDLMKATKNKYAHLKEIWPEVHLYYILAKIPTSLKDPNIPLDCKRFAKLLLTNRTSLRKRRMTAVGRAKAAKAFLRFCSKYELNYFIAYKQQFLSGISVEG